MSQHTVSSRISGDRSVLGQPDPKTGRQPDRQTGPEAEQPVALPTGVAPVGPGTRVRWLGAYRRRVAVVDAVVVLLAVLLAQWADVGVDDSRRVVGDQHLVYLGMSALVTVLWLTSLHLMQSRATRYLGAGHEEYSRVTRATVLTFGVLTIADVALRIEEFRGYLFVAAPVGSVLLLTGRWLQRRWVARRRTRGLDTYRVLLVGRPESARDLIATLHREPDAGHVAVGICVPANPHSRDLSRTEAVTVDGQDIPVLGTWHEIDTAVRTSGACTVAVMSSESLDPTAMRELSWRLDQLGVDMVVAPNLVDVDTMRVTTRPVAGLPLLHIEGPRHEQANKLLKSVFDRLGAAALLLALSPVLIACAVAVRLSSPGPIFYAAQRIGVDGRAFPMIKFRSMVPDADRLLDGLVAEQGGTATLFKMKDDPRITPIGKVLRRYSLDELPQLFNVLRGEMSLVGPRPQTAKEVAEYTGLYGRRLLVRPGMTGLWQVSGRSDLSYEQSQRLDLSYVENWSPALDMIILWRTARAVFGSSGAY